MQAYMDEEERKRQMRGDKPTAVMGRPGSPRPQAGRDYKVRKGTGPSLSERKKKEAATMLGAAELATLPFGFSALSKLARTGAQGAVKKGTTRLAPKAEKEALNKIGAQRPGAKTTRNPLTAKKKAPTQTTKPVGDGKETFKLRGAQKEAMEELGKIDPKVWATKTKTAPKPTPKKSTIGEAFTKPTKPAAKKVPAGKRPATKRTTGPKKALEDIAKRSQAQVDDIKAAGSLGVLRRTGIATTRDASGKVIAKKVPAKKVGSRGSTVTTDPKTGATTMRDASGKVIAKKVPAGKRPATKPAAKKVTKVPRRETVEESLRQTQKINRDAVIKKALEEAERVGQGTGPGGKLTASEVLAVSKKALRRRK